MAIALLVRGNQIKHYQSWTSYIKRMESEYLPMITYLNFTDFKITLERYFKGDSSENPSTGVA